MSSSASVSFQTSTSARPGRVSMATAPRASIRTTAPVTRDTPASTASLVRLLILTRDAQLSLKIPAEHRSKVIPGPASPGSSNLDFRKCPFLIHQGDDLKATTIDT